MSVCGGAKSAMETIEWWRLVGYISLAVFVVVVISGLIYTIYLVPIEDKREQTRQKTFWRELEEDAQDGTKKEEAEERKAALATLGSNAQWNL